MTKDELVIIIKEYNDYVQEIVSTKVKDLLTWLSVNYIK